MGFFFLFVDDLRHFRLLVVCLSQPKTVSLDLAAKVLIGDPTVDKTQSLLYKSELSSRL